MQNKAAVMHGTHDVRLEDVPVPEPGPNEVLVEIKAVGVCVSDVHYYEESRIGSFVVEEPLILGHESMGTVVALGEDATKHEVGDRVTLHSRRPRRDVPGVQGRALQPVSERAVLRDAPHRRRLHQLCQHQRGLRLLVARGT
jgi:threonine dehydrogenase-like Zn-dependent dehydrogenase